MSTPVPRVTVAMPVYNGAATVARAIDSILQQTFRDFELVLIDDGCSDNTIDIVRSYNDPRIRLIMHETNQGLAATRNHLVDQARGEFIAWLDCDDWSHPERLDRQVAAFETNALLVLCGTWTEYILEPPRSRARKALGSLYERGCTTTQDLDAVLTFRNPFATSSMMVRRATINLHQLKFDQGYAPAEDYKMWAELCTFGDSVRIPRTLTQIWVYGTGASSTGRAQQIIGARQTRLDFLHRKGFRLDDKQIAAHVFMTECSKEARSLEQLYAAGKWLDQIQVINTQIRSFDESAFRHCCAERSAHLVWHCADGYPRELHHFIRASRTTTAMPIWAIRRITRAVVAR